MTRPSLDLLFMGSAELWAKRSTCLRGNIGVVVVRDKRIITTGYNGSPPGAPHCTDVGCLEHKLVFPGGGSHVVSGCTRTVHAEANALAFAARHGVRTEGATMYCTHSPCVACALLVGSAGIVEVVYRDEYRVRDGLDRLEDFGLTVRQFDIGRDS